MDKYQIKALELLNINLSCIGRAFSKKANAYTKVLGVEGDSILVRDDKDINSKEYQLQLYVGLNLTVEALFNGKWVKYDNANHTNHKGETFDGVIIDFSIDKRPEMLRLSFPNNVVDPLELKLEYELVTEEEYERIQNDPERLRKVMNVSVRTADRLVNIYWQHAKENIVGLVRIDLYMGSVGSGQLMGKYKENDEVFFKSIDGLAYGNYYFKLFQFDKNNNEIASTDFISFTIKKPETNNGGEDRGGTSGGFGRNGRHTVIIG